MKATDCCSLLLLCGTTLGSAVLAQSADGPFYQCTPSMYEAAGVKLDCAGADKASENCEPFDMRVAELRESSGSLLRVETTRPEGRAFVDTVTIVRASGAFTETETLDGVLVAKTVGACVLKKPAASG